jgi:hypothetical protein
MSLFTGVKDYFVSKKCVFFLFVLFVVNTNSTFAQNLISVSFQNGFVGVNTANNVASNCLLTSNLGWSNLQFTQNSTSNVFVAQGNDIIGNILITDYAGVEHTIEGYVKWRNPSGNSPNTIIFSTVQTVVLATSGGVNLYDCSN